MSPKGRFDEYSSEFSLSKKPRFNRILEKAKLKKVMLALLCQLQRGTCTQHNQILCSQLTMRLSISPVCCKQRNKRIEWKAIVVCEKVNSASKVNR
jgi:hypothetical protein